MSTSTKATDFSSATAPPSPGDPAGASSSSTAGSSRAPLNGTPPPSFDRGSGMPALADEPAASAQLAQHGSTAEWERRADWLESEARAQTDSSVRARLLLAASEIRAMCGARPEARRLAAAATSEAGAPTLALRQSRGLGHTDADALARGLRLEAQSATVAATRANAHYLAAEVARLLQRDDKAAEFHLDASEQCDTGDLRPPLRRVARHLARSTKAPDVRLRPDEALRPLRQALGQVAQLRGAEAPRSVPTEVSALPLAEALRALSRGRPEEAADSLQGMEAQPDLAGPIRWLTALWRSASNSAAHLERLTKLAQESGGRAEWCAVAAHALARGQAEPVLTALRESSVFSRVERVTLAALVDQPMALPASERGGGDPELPRPLQSALSRLWSAGALPLEALGPAEADLHLGREVAPLARFCDVAPASGETEREPSLGAQLLSLEQSRELGDLPRLAAGLASYASAPAARAEACFVAALWSEKAGAMAEARELYRAALAAPATREAAGRILGRGEPDGAAIFRSLSAQTTDPQRRSSLLFEALLRLRPDAAEYDALAEEALRTDPEQALVEGLAELAARMRGDRARVARWLGRTRERSRGADDDVYARLREVLFLLQDSRTAAADGLKDLLDTSQPEPALRQLYEDLDAPPWTERLAALRRAAAQTASPRVREALSFRATCLAERHGLRARGRGCASGGWQPAGQAPVPEQQRTDLDALTATAQARIAIERDPVVLRSLYELLADCDMQRGERERADQWQREILLLDPGNLRALRFLELSSILAGRLDELERVAATLASVLDGPAKLGRAFVSARLAVDRGAFDEARSHAAAALTTPAPPLWALRLEAEHARVTGDDERLLAAQLALRKTALHPLDSAALAARVAELRVRRGEPESALAELGRARALRPNHVALLMLHAEATREARDAALAYEEVANQARAPALRAEAWFRAATLWLDAVPDRERGVHALRRAAECGIPHRGTLARVRELFGPSTAASLEAGARILELSEADAEAKVERARVLSDAGEADEARRTLNEVFSFYPAHDAGLLLAGLLRLRERDFAGAEAALWHVAEAASSAGRALEALRALAALYDGELRNAERSCETCQRILEYQPDDLAIRRRLVQELAAAGDPASAAHHQRELVARAPTDDERRDQLLELIDLLASTPEGAPEAERLLEQALRTWPEHVAVLCAAADHYRRIGNAASARVVVERTAHAARNAIRAGRIELDLFRMLATAGRLSGDAALVRSAHAALMALQGEPDSAEGASLTALDSRFDALLAPAPLSAALRDFLYAAGDALERAYAPDLRHFDTAPVPEPHVEEVRALMASCDVADLRALYSVPLGFDCLCQLREPSYILFGQALLEHPNPRVREYVLLRAIKLAKLNAGALSRMPPDDVWAAVAGFLACFAPPWPASGAEAQRLIVNRNKIRPHVTAAFGPELGALAAAVTANAVPQAAQLGEALWRWASRVALLATGDLEAALEAAWASSQPSLHMPKDSGARLRWLATHQQARDLVGFSVSEAYTEARRRAGLVQGSRSRAPDGGKPP